MADIVQLRRDTAANWTSEDPTLANGEYGYETDTAKRKIGDGVTAWTALAYLTATAAAHASDHTDGTDDIQDATNTQKGLALAAHIIAIEGIERLDVYNNSGAGLNIGDVVYVSGYNIGQALSEVSLADADSGSAMPSIGILDAAIPNTTAGTVVMSGLIEGINTAGYSVGDSLYVGTTAGEFVNVRPTVDAIQKLGLVLKVDANGKALLVGAGRSNDVPIQPSFTDFTNANHDHTDAASGGVVSGGGGISEELAIAYAVVL